MGDASTEKFIVGELNLIGGQRWTFLDFDDNLWSKSSIHTVCCPLGPIVDATVNESYRLPIINALECGL